MQQYCVLVKSESGIKAILPSQTRLHAVSVVHVEGEKHLYWHITWLKSPSIIHARQIIHGCDSDYCVIQLIAVKKSITNDAPDFGGSRWSCTF